ncbi:uncharacterized protein NECHADRAFT_75615 [Fusarium vanettenii 77-13-4]|uniref:DUF6594 domain-containing protein n=1 Tax=Fusarium vanettenii (strain ATCC MYA-4622 / CBS 123669 / FGSC 9596 / NRRL 45880 / 77-13-4) TaxID=660122 RepID=C7YJA9_FUSV7|nr:uncharacterized protein NECHADRAFT_75615 [Fusarium vanettenii 77-13-4]EEU48239.1 hypothetical protein NECHADRAFT_75615 [Fusarium vanettenii 77-13-4]
MTEADSPFSGYATFASFLASDPELSIFRGFQQLSSRNLLYLQSELLELENQLKEFDQDDAQKADLDVMLLSKCWEVFSARAQEQPREAERMEVISRIRTLTKEYYEALLLRREIMKLPKPEDRVYKVFKEWFQSETPFVGYGSRLLQDQDDFIALSPAIGDDALSRSLRNLAGTYLSGSRHDATGRIKYYSERHVSRLVTVVTVIAASLLIEAAVVALYLIKNEALRLAMIAVFTSVFAASLALMTDGRRTDIILATAACAAVLVAFVAAGNDK